MKTFMTSTAIALALGTSALAENHTSVFSGEPFDANINLYAGDLLGARVYATENQLEATMTAGDETEWDDIGDINEILLTRDGKVQSVIVGVGGFLGIGEKDVAVNMNDLQFISDGEDADEYFLVIKTNVAGIEDAPAFEQSDMSDEMDKTADTADKQVDRLMAPNVERDGYNAAKVADLTTEDLTGARVYGIDDEDVGEISELLLTDDGKLDRAVVDVGGFIGIGEHPVAVGMDELTIIRSDDNGDLRVYIDSSEGKLESQPAYDG